MQIKVGVMGSHKIIIDKDYECNDRMYGLPLGYRVWQVIVSKERY